uniref:Putative secreted protein n=1 Tax=Anopheles triannulatus TaxID=58253 RepID=A0A2M4B3W4_9DIPT
MSRGWYHWMLRHWLWWWRSAVAAVVRQWNARSSARCCHDDRRWKLSLLAVHRKLYRVPLAVRVLARESS